MSTPETIEHRLSIANALADAAGAAILPYFRSNSLDIENKKHGGYDPVTLADRAAETAMRQVLERECPEDGIIGEEFGSAVGSSGLTWVLDPIDGTRGFIAGTPTWGVLIALSDESGPKLGIIDQPYIGERFVGCSSGAWLTKNGRRNDLKTSKTTQLSDAVLFTTFPEVGTADERNAFDAVSKCTKLTRYGMDCYAYALVASGQVDLVIEAGLNAYDIQGPIGVVEAAGGIVTDWSGDPAHRGGRAIAAANAEIHAAALEILKASMNG